MSHLARNSAEPRGYPSDFLVTELEICRTLLRVSEAELRAGWRDAAGRALEGAEKAYEAIRRLLPSLENNLERSEFESKSNLVREMLDSLRRKLMEDR